jgi:hypothetical protein
MTVIFRNDGAWGIGKGSRLTSLEIDNNFWTLVQQIEDLVSTAGGAGKLITSTTYSGNVLTFHYSDSSSDAIPLPWAKLNFPAVPWTNSILLAYLDVIVAPDGSLFVVLQPHTTPAPPAPFDPNATDDGTPTGKPLYALMLPARDVNYDVAGFTPGNLQREPGELFLQYIAPRDMRMIAGLGGEAWAYLGTAIEQSTGAVDIVLSIEKNGGEIGTITFTAGEQDTAGGQDGAIVFLADVAFTGGDRIAIRVAQSQDPVAADLSITLPALRTETP